jgi:hypothetical protein
VLGVAVAGTAVADSQFAWAAYLHLETQSAGTEDSYLRPGSRFVEAAGNPPCCRGTAAVAAIGLAAFWAVPDQSLLRVVLWGAIQGDKRVMYGRRWMWMDVDEMEEREEGDKAFSCDALG